MNNSLEISSKAFLNICPSTINPYKAQLKARDRFFTTLITNSRMEWQLSRKLKDSRKDWRRCQEKQRLKLNSDFIIESHSKHINGKLHT